MKIRCKKKLNQRRFRVRCRYEGGFVATVMFITLLVIMLMLAMAGAAALFHLHNEVRTLEQQQVKRLNSSMTNSVPNAQLSITKLDKQ